MNESISTPDWREEVREKVERAIATALPFEEEEKRTRENAILGGQRNRGEITAEEYANRRNSGEEGAVYFKTLPEFTEALKILGISDEKAGDILAHENDHHLAADKYKDQYGLDIRYGLHFGLDGTRLHITPVVSETHDDIGDENERILSREIASAPDEMKNQDSIIHG